MGICPRGASVAASTVARPQPAPGKKGCPWQKGRRLPNPEQLAQRTRKWATVEAPWRRGTLTRLAWSRPVLWYNVSPKAMVFPHGRP